MTTPRPGYDEIVLTASDGAALCSSLACARAGRAAEVIVTCGVLNDPGLPPYQVHGACDVSSGVGPARFAARAGSSPVRSL